MFDFVLFNFLHSTLHIIALHFAPARLRFRACGLFIK